MKKLWIIMLAVIVIVIGIMIGAIIVKSDNKKDNIEIENIQTDISEIIEDECTNEYEEIEKKTSYDIEANSNEEKISPNCKIILKKYYKVCNHIINEYIDITNNLINKTKEDLQKEYPNWEIQKYSSTEIILYKEFDSSCGQHYIIKNNEGKISIYVINQENQEIPYEDTEISTEFLTEEDKEEVEKGIKVYGKEKLNELIENFE